jgi:hypothetical protein
LAPPNALLAVGAAVGGVVVLVVVAVLVFAVVGVVLAAAVVEVVPAAVVEVVVGAVVVVVVELFFFDDAVVVVVFDEALGVLEPHAAAIRPPASTMVPRSQRVPLRFDAVPVVPRVTRANPNTYCSSRWRGAHSADPGARKIPSAIPSYAT